MNKNAEKGMMFEELLRAYFFHSGMFVIRGIPVVQQNDELSDIDIWLYDKPTGLSRRVQILDAKFKNKPKAIDRLLWTKGMSALLEVDGAYVATTDRRNLVKHIGNNLNILVIDGTDLSRLSQSSSNRIKTFFQERLTEDEFESLISSVDKSRRKGKELSKIYRSLKTSLIEKFGIGSLNRALEFFSVIVNNLIVSHPNSEAANIYTRLTYFASSIIAISIDFCLSKVAFRTIDEQKMILSNIIRFGNDDSHKGLERVRVASALVEKYLPNGRALSQAMLDDIYEDYKRINSEMIVDYVLDNKQEILFKLGRNFEMNAFSRDLPSFDRLSQDEKSFLGIILDFSGCQRNSFANAWTK